MAAQTLLIFRHAEKPELGVAAGVDADGNPDSKSLTPRGWQRAGAWAELFVPSFGQPGLLTPPAVIFASAPATHAETAADGEGSKSRRPLETVQPLAGKLGVNIDLRFSKGQEAALAGVLDGLSGVVAVCWQHENIADIAHALSPAPAGVPAHWPGDCFNLVFRFRRDGGSDAAWSFDQVAPVMLGGDVDRTL